MFSDKTLYYIVILFLFRLILLILIKLSLSTLEREISSLIFRLEVAEDDPEDDSVCKVLDMNDVEETFEEAFESDDETKDENVSNSTEEREGDDKDSPKAENVETAEPDIAIASGSKDPVVMIKDLTALITTLASKFNGNNPPAAPGREAIKYKEPAPAAKKQEVLNYLKSVPLKDTVLHTQLHHTLHHSEDKFYS